MTEDRKVAIVKRGTWRRDDREGHVFVIRQNWDHYHDGYMEGDPDLGPDGFAYYALFGIDESLEAATSRSPTCLTESEAVARAERLIGPVEWS
jgi:hypothetical protein